MKILSRVVLFIFLIFIIISSIFFTFAEENSKTNKFNILFIMDGSGSISSTDPQGWRIEAIRYFLGVLSETGNKVGGLVFNDQIISKQEMIEINNNEDKNSIISLFENAPVISGTDIGKALYNGTQMLNNNRNEDFPSVIVLMTDGNTDLSGNGAGTIEESNSLKTQAIDYAKQNKYPVYCVGLNANGKVNSDEMKFLSDETGGKFIEISTPLDLTFAFNSFYNLINENKTNQIFEGEGVFDVKFKVPAFGVEEVNIIIHSTKKINDLKLYSPSGTILSGVELDKITIYSKSFSIIKIQKPAKGDWRITGTGVPGDKIKIDTIQNFDFTIKTDILNEKTNYYAGNKISFIAQIVSNDIPTTELSIYKGYNAKVLFKRDSTGEIVEIPMTANGSRYICELHLENEGIYNATVKIVGDNVNKSSPTHRINVLSPIVVKPDDFKIEVPNNFLLPIIVVIAGIIIIFLIVFLIIRNKNNLKQLEQIPEGQVKYSSCPNCGEVEQNQQFNCEKCGAVLESHYININMDNIKNKRKR